MAAKKSKKKKVTTKPAKRTAAKKKPVKKAAPKKAVVKKVTKPKATPAKKVSVKSPFTKTQINSYLAEATDLSKKQVTEVFDALSVLIKQHVSSSKVAEFTLPGLLKVRVVRKPATKARKGINPFTGEETMFKAKPARNVVRVKPLKKLKDMV